MEDFGFASAMEDDHHYHHRHHTIPHYASSPLWFLPSIKGAAACLHSSDRRSLSSEDTATLLVGKLGDVIKLSSCQNMVTPPTLGGLRHRHHLANDEERMDMLWEVFNDDELEHDRPATSMRTQRHNSKDTAAADQRHQVQGVILSNSKHDDMPTLLRLLKRLFLMHKIRSMKATPAGPGKT